jgi:drug/metabolite transporter (DMT)-like permease
VESFGWFIAAIAGALIFGTGGYFIRLGSSPARNAGIIVLFGLYLSGSLGFFLLSLSQGTFSADTPLLIGGFIIGLGSIFGNIFWVRAFYLGPSSLASPLVNSNTVLIVLMSIIFFDESLRLNEVIGVVMLLLSVALINYDPDEKLRVKNVWWYIFIALAIVFFFVRTGGLKVTEEFGLDNTLALGYGYTVGLVWFAVELARNRDLRRADFFRFSLKWGLISGVFSFIGLRLFTYAITNGPASIVSPIFSSNGLVFAFWTITFLGERLSRSQMIALFVAVAGLVILRI